MRSALLLLSLLAPINSLARRGRDLDYIPSPPLVSEDEAEDTLNSFELSAKDRQAVFGDTTIIKRLKVTDCHSSIAKQLAGRCKSEKHHMDPNEAYRSDLAISLTLCSLASAMQTIPSDCEAWYRSSSARENPGWRIWWNVPDTKSALARSACLGALHRSPQDWTSYNQYLSDATTLCSALRTDWQMNQARELYANATMEKISLISLLRKNDVGRREDQDRFTRDMFDGVKESRRNAETVSDTLEMLKNEIDSQEAVRSSLDTHIRQALEALTAAGEGIWDQVRSQGADAAMELLQDLRESHADMVISLSQQLRNSLSSLANEHGTSMDALHQRLASDTDVMIGHLRDTFALLIGDSETHLDTFNAKLAETSSEAAVLKGNVFSAATLIHDLHPALLSSAQSAFAIQDHHNQTLASLVQSRTAAMELSRELERSLEVISQTIALAQQNGRSRWALFSPSLFSVSAFNIPESAFNQHGLLGFAAKMIVQLVFGTIGYSAQMLYAAVLFLLWTTVAIYAVAHSRVRGLACRIAYRISSQFKSEAEDPVELEMKRTTPQRRFSKPIAVARKTLSEVKEEERDLDAELPILEDYTHKSRGGSGVRMGNSNLRSIVPSRRSRCVSAPL